MHLHNVMEVSAKILTGVLTAFINAMSACILFFGLSFSLNDYIPNEIRVFTGSIIVFNILAVILVSVSSVHFTTYFSQYKKISPFWASFNSILMFSIFGVILIVSSWVFGSILLNIVRGVT